MTSNRPIENDLDASIRKVLENEDLEAVRVKARQRERIQALGVDPNRVTSNRRQVLEFVCDEGTVDSKDVARKFYGGRNVRTAHAQLSALTNLGLIVPIRTAEFKVSVLGKKVLGC